MVFSSIIFLFYFLPVFLLVYYLADARYKNGVILAGSLFFYAWGAPVFVFTLLGATLADFFIVRTMAAQPRGARRTALLCVSLSINLGLLFYYKYCGFFVTNFNHVLAGLGMKPIEWATVILPIGISFYTFETVTYVVDVYRGLHQPLRRFRDYLLYILLFPKLIAGPIIRFHDFAGQIQDHLLHENATNRLRGFYRFILGLSKKVLIANVVGEAANTIFASQYGELGTVTAWMGALAYTFQIYFDFSGYSDMALGLALMMGFRFPENFDNPYTATSITDFWRRWHITLGSWMRNYLYIPLGGNRVQNKMRLYFNLWLVFLASGLWHGAAWGFIAWGAWHGAFLVAERMFLGKWLARLGKMSFLYTFVVVLVGWVFFRIEYVRASADYFKRMFAWHPDNHVWYADNLFVTATALAAVFSFFTLSKIGTRIQQQIYYGTYTLRMHYWATGISVVLLLLCAARITVATFNPFIYFRF